MDFDAVVVKEERVVGVRRSYDGKCRVDYYTYFSDGSVVHFGTWE